MYVPKETPAQKKGVLGEVLVVYYDLWFDMGAGLMTTSSGDRP